MKSFFLFTYTLFLSLLISHFFHSLLYFVPFIVLSFYRFSKASALFFSLLSGASVDLLATATPLGFYAFTYGITTLLLYRYRFFFFEERFLTLPLMTFCYSLLFMLLYALFLFLVGSVFLPPVSEILITPVVTALYSFIFFALPQLLKQRAHKTSRGALS